MPTLRTITLGCKVNQYETEYVRQGFLRLGYRQATDDQPADLCIVNTCTVTAEGDLKSRKAIRRMARKNPAAEIIVMGCYATRAESEVARLPGVVEVITDKRRLADLLARRGLIDVPRGISSFGRRHRAYVKVQDGCRMDCAYCIIPKVRSVPASRSPRDVLDEIRRLVDHSHREIVLTGIHLGHYGVDLAGHDTNTDRLDLTALVQKILSMDGHFRLRLSSLEAAEVAPRLIDLMAEQPDRICPHLHLSMQSGSDAVLKRMRRRWMSRRFVDKCLSIREALDYPALTTDVIVGFPGETESDFEATCQAVEAVEFSKVHVFRFSPRQGTPAASLPDDVPAAEKQRRAAELITLGEQLRRRFFDGLVGRELQVLVESTSDQRPGVLLGTSARYAPVELPGPEDWIGRLVKVTAGKVADGRILAENLTDSPSDPPPFVVVEFALAPPAAFCYTPASILVPFVFWAAGEIPSPRRSTSHREVKMSTHLVLRLVTPIVCLIGVTSTQVAAGPWDLLTFNRVEADPQKSYRLSEEHGPWMIMACSFSGERATEQARELVLELRSRYKLPAYTFNKEFDFTEGTVGRGVDPYGAPLRMRNKRGDGTVECAVLVGEFPAVDDKKAQTTLKRLKYYQPECLELDQSKPTSRSLAALRVIQQNLLKPGNEKKKRGPMGHAFIIPNPLLPKDYFISSGVDQFTVRLNKDNKYSLLKCPGKYTVRVAHFRGNATIDQKEIQAIENGRKKVSDRLERAAEDAETLCKALREEGYEAYMLHERYASIVTVGSFNSVGTPRRDGHIEMSPEILATIERFKATKAPGVPANDKDPSNLRPKSLVGIPIPFDLQPTVVRAPKRSISDDYTSSRNPIRSLW